MSPSGRCYSSAAAYSVLVAGVTGTIGRAVARALAKEQWAVRGVARLKGEVRDMSPMGEDSAVEFRVADLSMPDMAQAACAGASDIVYAVGSSGVSASFDDPIGNLLDNSVPFLQVLQNCSAGTRVVLVSSQLVYGLAGERPFVEDDETHPASPYAVNRLLLEEYGRVIGPIHGVETVVLRLGNVFGEVVDIDYPRKHGFVARMLHDLVRTGEAHVFGAGRQTVDLLHADDLASAIVAVLKSDRNPNHFAIYNVQGERLTVREVGEELSVGLGGGNVIDVAWPEGAAPAAMARDILLSDRRFRSRFDWRPTQDARCELRRLASSWRGR